MREFLREFFTILVLGLIAVVSELVFTFLVPSNAWLEAALFLALTALYVVNSIKTIPANPPSKGILTFLGERQEVVLGEGWNYVPLYPWIFSFILVKVEKVNFDLESQEVRTPDRAVISVKASVTWKPGIEDKPESYIAYLNSGGEAGVKKIISDVIEDRIKTWAGSNKEGPSTWMEAQAMKDDAHEVLVKSLLGDALSKVDSNIPTNTWMRFLDDPKSEPTKYDAISRPSGVQWAKKDEATGSWNWDGLQAIFNSYSADEKTRLANEVAQRRREIKRIREGKGEFGDESMGITIIRFSVNEVKVEGEVAKAAEMEEKERREMDADTMEINNVSKRIEGLRHDHPGMSLELANRIVQTERGKISQSVIEVLGASTGLGQDGLGMLGVQKMLGAVNAPTQTPPADKGGQREKKKTEDMTIEEKRAEYERQKAEYERQKKGGQKGSA